MALPQSPFIKVYDEAFLTLLLDLIDICDSFDQIGKMARIVNILYSPGESEFYRLHEQIRSTYTHLRGLRGVGGGELSPTVNRDIAAGVIAVNTFGGGDHHAAK